MTDANAEKDTADKSSPPEAGSARKATRAPQTRPVAPKKSKTAKKATQRKRALKTQKDAKTARTGTKKEKLIAMMQRSEGATLAELIRASGWNGNSVRGFISGQLGKKMKVKVTSNKREDGQRVYRLCGAPHN
jgi:hypothetical protein